MREILKEEKTLSQIAVIYEIHPSLAAQWRDQALAGLVGIFSRGRESDRQAKEAAYEEERQGLYAEIGRLSMQLAWLKKAGKFIEYGRAPGVGGVGGERIERHDPVRVVEPEPEWVVLHSTPRHAARFAHQAAH